MTVTETTYTTPQTAQVTGASFRQLDYWTRTGTVIPTVPACGSGSVRQWTLIDVALAKVAYVLSRHGAHSTTISVVVRQLREDPAWWDETETVFVSEDGDLRRRLTDKAPAAWAINLSRAFIDVAGALGALQAA